MKKFIFNGNSDDTFGEYNETNIDYDNCASGSPIQYKLVNSDGAGVVVTGLYGHSFHVGHGWTIGVNTLDEDKPIDWSFDLSPSHEGYRNKLTITTPDDVVLELIDQ